jgi:hypothetical protein
MGNEIASYIEQDGWDVGVNYGLGPGALRALTNKIAPGTFALPSYVGGGVMQAHQIKRLAIVAHGAPGIMDVDQESSGGFGVHVPVEAKSLSVPRLSVYSREIADLADLLDRDSVVLLAACNVGDSTAGENLLKQLSDKWPSTKVVGIRSLGAVPVGNIKPGLHAMFAGLRDTRYQNGNAAPNEVRDYDDPTICADLVRLPWMSENSPHATVALDGNVIRRGTAAEA